MSNAPIEPARPTPANGLVIAGFVVSILAILASFVGGGFIPGIVAAVLLGIGGRQGRTSLGTAGIVLSVIAILLSIVVTFARVANGG